MPRATGVLEPCDENLSVGRREGWQHRTIAKSHAAIHSRARTPKVHPTDLPQRVLALRVPRTATKRTTNGRTKPMRTTSNITAVRTLPALGAGALRTCTLIGCTVLTIPGEEPGHAMITPVYVASRRSCGIGPTPPTRKQLRVPQRLSLPSKDRCTARGSARP